MASDAIQQAIDDANQAGGGTVYIPAGVYLSGNLTLKKQRHLLSGRRRRHCRHGQRRGLPQRLPQRFHLGRHLFYPHGSRLREYHHARPRHHRRQRNRDAQAQDDESAVHAQSGGKGSSTTWWCRWRPATLRSTG
ncbi:hypothetical protein [Cohnella rhizosphaerae]|uniref:Pectate lyase superfamily protein domain-containing protein n=1 Tax=Cohnella rhizosphaerae TaxID=1457232 RepID=A0A9X4KVP8_9BACL|nr:hypothetical protein [Cohnella rhizosphaerae]MDG0811171.1 hypothetical protein [Cohnella rhizosphaerae]